jgi:hypothetical protein
MGLLAFATGNVFKAIQTDISEGRLKHVEPEWREAIRVSDELSADYSEEIGTAAVDVWHVASAIVLRAEVFWTFDEVQYSLAKRCGRFPKVPKLQTA